MKRVTGIGGIFFKAKNQKKMYEWYEKHLGLVREPHGQCVTLRWREADHPEREGLTAWSIFETDTKYFNPGSAPFMINYRVDDLEGLLTQLRRDGIQIVKGPESDENGRFVWILDPDGNKVELWQPMPKPH